MLPEIFQYSFMVRSMAAGLMLAIIAPFVGLFLVLRRYSLIADTLSHVSLAGIAAGLIFGVNPIIAALAATSIASLGIERLRISKKVYGESALAIFLSGSLAFALVLLSFSNKLNSGIINYLFGSILTVSKSDLYVISLLMVISFALLGLFYKELVYIAFDEESAKASGIPVRLVNTVLMILSALVVTVAIPTIGVLLISALMVIPVASALQLQKSFLKTALYSQAISVFSVISGMVASFYLNIASGAAIVLVMLTVFSGMYLLKKIG